MNGDKMAKKYEMSNKMSNKDQDRLKALVDYLDTNGFIAKSEAAKILGVEDKTAQRLSVKAVKLGVLVAAALFAFVPNFLSHSCLLDS